MKKSDISEEEFPANSKSSRVAPIRPRRSEKQDIQEEKTEETRLTSVGKGIRRKKSLVESVAWGIAGDATKDVLQYVLRDVLLPAAKNMLQEAVSSGFEMLLFGEARPRGKSKDRDSIVSYGSFYRGRDRDESPYKPSRSRRAGRFDLDDILFKDHGEAEDVLTNLCDQLEKYHQVTVADFYELADIEGGTWADDKWGWTDLRRAYCTHARGGWAIVLPKPVELD